MDQQATVIAVQRGPEDIVLLVAAQSRIKEVVTIRQKEGPVLAQVIATLVPRSGRLDGTILGGKTDDGPIGAG